MLTYFYFDGRVTLLTKIRSSTTLPGSAGVLLILGEADIFIRTVMIWQGFEVCYVHTIAIHNYRVSKKTEVITNLQRQFVWSSELPYNKGDKKLPLT